MQFERPKRKTYKLVITTAFGDVVLKYKQATFNESMDYFEKVEKGTISTKYKSILEYREAFFDKSFYSSNKKRYNIFDKAKKEAKKKIVEYVAQIESSLHKRRESVYINSPKPKNKEAKKSYFEQSIFALSKATLIPVHKVYDILTLEQVLRLNDKLLHDYYWTFKEGERVNNILEVTRPKTEEEKEKIQREIEEIKSLLPKK